MKFKATIYNYRDENETLNDTFYAFCFEEAVSQVYIWRLNQGMNWRVKTVDEVRTSTNLTDNQQGPGKVQQ